MVVFPEPDPPATPMTNELMRGRSYIAVPMGTGLPTLGSLTKRGRAIAPGPDKSLPRCLISRRSA